MDSHIAIFQTNQPHEVLLVQNHFKELGIPHFGQERSVTGLRTAMPLTPVPEPGIAWAIMVPDVAIEDAKRVISDLGLITKPEDILWRTGPAEDNPVLKIIYIGILIIFVLGALMNYFNGN